MAGVALTVDRPVANDGDLTFGYSDEIQCSGKGLIGARLDHKQEQRRPSRKMRHDYFVAHNGQNTCDML